jgi:hypothetical protein
MAADLPILYARRGYGYANGSLSRPLTFLSRDEADRHSSGYQDRWFEDGAEVEHGGGVHRLVHVYSPSWRCAVPQRLAKAEAA